jgi:hypothetical protein
MDQRNEWFETTSSQNPLQPANNDHYLSNDHHYMGSFDVPREPRNTDSPDSWNNYFGDNDRADTIETEEEPLSLQHRPAENTWHEYYPNLQPLDETRNLPEEDTSDEEMVVRKMVRPKMEFAELHRMMTFHGAELEWISRQHKDLNVLSFLCKLIGVIGSHRKIANGSETENINCLCISEPPSTSNRKPRFSFGEIAQLQSRRQAKQASEIIRESRTTELIPSWLFTDEPTQYDKDTYLETGETFLPEWLFQIETDSSQHLNC